MTNIDQFESVFKSATKASYTYRPVTIASLLVVTDLGGDDLGGDTPDDAAEAFASQAQKLLHQPTDQADLDLHVLRGRDFQSVGELLDQVARHKPDLICTYRNLHSTAWQWSHSLGVHLDVLTQVTDAAVLLLPHPARAEQFAAAHPARRVMAITDHLTGDDRLVSFAASLTQPGGTLYLAHVEDAVTFERYLETISKVPSIDTENARDVILEQLLKEPKDYIARVRDALHAEDLLIEVEARVRLGHHLTDYGQLIAEDKIELLVFNTKDEGQLAMHGVAYSLAVEMRDVPMLLL